MTTRKAALGFCRRGINVVPLKNGTSRLIGPERRWFRERQTEADVLGLFGNYENHNVGVVTGSLSSNLVVLNFSVAEVFTQLFLENSRFARACESSPIVYTAHGVHVYLRLPCSIPSSRIQSLSLSIHGEGAFIIAPPSVLISPTRRFQLSFYKQGRVTPRLSVLSDLSPLSFLPARYTQAVAA